MPPPASNPHYAQHAYGATAPYESNYNNNNNNHNNTQTSNASSGGGGSWLSGLGGMAVGAALGSGVQRQWDRTTTPGGGHDDVTGYRDTPGGGYDIAGDTGDGGGGGYDIAGDTGGDDGGYDIEGDF